MAGMGGADHNIRTLERETQRSRITQISDARRDGQTKRGPFRGIPHHWHERRAFRQQRAGECCATPPRSANQRNQGAARRKARSAPSGACVTWS